MHLVFCVVAALIEMSGGEVVRSRCFDCLRLRMHTAASTLHSTEVHFCFVPRRYPDVSLPT